jgi:hypothetical protein
LRHKHLLLLHLHLRDSEIHCRHLIHVSKLVECSSPSAICGSLEGVKAGTSTKRTATGTTTGTTTRATNRSFFRFQHVEVEYNIEYLILLLDVIYFIGIFLKFNELIDSLSLFILSNLNKSIDK